MARQTKGHRLQDRMMRVIGTGSACVGCMSWETPYIEFEDEIGNKYRWHSDRAGWGDADTLRVGDRVRMNAFDYPTDTGWLTLRRVRFEIISRRPVPV